MLKLSPRGEGNNVSEGERKLELLLDLGAMLAREVELDELLKVVGERVASALEADRATLWLVDSKDGTLRSRVANLPELDELSIAAGQGVVGHVAMSGQAVNIADAAGDKRFAPDIDRRTGYQTNSMLCAPISGAQGHLLGVVQVLNKKQGSFCERDEVFLTTLADQIARALAYTTLRSTGKERGVPLGGPFNHIVGSSPAMDHVYGKILKAAGTDATVLLHGETGTGKGLFARAIHVNSPRKDGPLVHIDCTNLPASLVESELFGHERGAYTGADARVVGKVEQANGGTLFLDEVGELPLSLQSKLLRFLQDKNYERVGGRETLVADVRIVAATNRSLEDMVQSGDFRSDLYYRLRVIDVALPTLRERNQGDIVALADHFFTLYCRRYNRTLLPLSPAATRALSLYSWPGNVRELEHCIERAVVLAGGDQITPDDLGLESIGEMAPDPTNSIAVPRHLSLDEATARYAKQVLSENDNNRSATARALNIGRNRLARILDSES
jgi:Nif-specific regulatory protein